MNGLSNLFMLLEAFSALYLKTFFLKIPEGILGLVKSFGHIVYTLFQETQLGLSTLKFSDRFVKYSKSTCMVDRDMTLMVVVHHGNMASNLRVINEFWSLTEP